MYFFYPSLICLSCNPPPFTHSFFTWQTVCSVLMMFSSSFIVGTITLHFLSVKLWRWICRAPSNTDKSSSVSCQITLKELEPTKQNKPELNEWCMKYFWGGGCTGFIFILLGQIISRQTRIEDVWLFFLSLYWFNPNLNNFNPVFDSDNRMVVVILRKIKLTESKNLCTLGIQMHKIFQIL